MNHNEYKKYLKYEHWRVIRTKFISERGGKCEDCGTTENLHIHHMHYRTIGKEKKEDVEILCANCHEYKHLKEEAQQLQH